MPFYAWMWSALRTASDKQGSAFALVDGATVLSQASGHGIEPVARTSNRRRNIAHLAFYDDQIPPLAAMARDLGAAFLIRARLVANDAKMRRVTEAKVLGLKVQGDFKELTRHVSIEFMVYDVAADRVAFTREFSASDTSGWPGSSKADARVASRIASGVLAALSSDAAHRPLAEEADSAVVAVERKAAIGAVARDGSAISGALPGYRVDLQRIVRYGGLLRFDLTLWNTTDEEVRAILKRDARNEIESYIVDSLRIRTRAVSASLENMTVLARAGEKKAFFIVFPVPATNLKKVSLSSLWDLRAPGWSQALSVKLANVALP